MSKSLSPPRDDTSGRIRAALRANGTYDPRRAPLIARAAHTQEGLVRAMIEWLNKVYRRKLNHWWDGVLRGQGEDQYEAGKVEEYVEIRSRRSLGGREREG